MLYCSEANNFQKSDFDDSWLLPEELLKLVCAYARENPNLNNDVKKLAGCFTSFPSVLNGIF